MSMHAARRRKRPRSADPHARGRDPGVGVGEAERAQQGALARFHAPRIGGALVVVALRVQRAMHEQVRVVRLERDARGPRLGLEHRCAQHEVGDDLRLAFVVEGQHVGRVVAPAVAAVERAALVGADDAHGDARVGLERAADPARHAVARQPRTVACIGELQRKGERRPGFGRPGGLGPFGRLGRLAWLDRTGLHRRAGPHVTSGRAAS
jgi:hypothetical protein